VEQPFLATAQESAEQESSSSRQQTAAAEFGTFLLLKTDEATSM
jgi:hypothetical protein